MGSQTSKSKKLLKPYEDQLVEVNRLSQLSEKEVRNLERIDLEKTIESVGRKLEGLGSFTEFEKVIRKKYKTVYETAQASHRESINALKDILVRFEAELRKLTCDEVDLTRVSKKKKKKNLGDISDPFSGKIEEEEEEANVDATSSSKKTLKKLYPHFVERMGEIQAEKEEHLRNVRRIREMIDERNERLEVYGQEVNLVVDVILQLVSCERKHLRVTKDIEKARNICLRQITECLRNLKRKKDAIEKENKNSVRREALHLFPELKDIVQIMGEVIPSIEKFQTLLPKAEELKKVQREYYSQMKEIKGDEKKRNLWKYLSGIFHLREQQIRVDSDMLTFRSQIGKHCWSFMEQPKRTQICHYEETVKKGTERYDICKKKFGEVTNTIIKKSEYELQQIVENYESREERKFIDSSHEFAAKLETRMKEFWKVRIADECQKLILDTNNILHEVRMCDGFDEDDECYHFMNQFVDLSNTICESLISYDHPLDTKKRGVMYDEYVVLHIQSLSKHIQKEISGNNHVLYNLMNELKNFSRLEKRISTDQLFGKIGEFFQRATFIMDHIEMFCSVSKKYKFLEKLIIQVEESHEKKWESSNYSSEGLKKMVLTIKKEEEMVARNSIFLKSQVSPLLGNLRACERKKFRERFRESVMVHEEIQRRFRRERKKTEEELMMAGGAKNENSFGQWFQFWEAFAEKLEAAQRGMKESWGRQISWCESFHEKVNDLLRQVSTGKLMLERTISEFLRQFNILFVLMKNHSHQLNLGRLHSSSQLPSGGGRHSNVLCIGEIAREGGAGGCTKHGEVIELSEKEIIRTIFVCNYSNGLRKGQGVKFEEDGPCTCGMWEGDACILRSIHSSQISDEEAVCSNCWRAKYYKNREEVATVYLRRFPSMNPKQVMEKIESQKEQEKAMITLKVIGMVGGWNDVSRVDLSNSVVLEFKIPIFEELFREACSSQGGGGSNSISNLSSYERRRRQALVLYGSSSSSSSGLKEKMRQVVELMPGELWAKWSNTGNVIKSEIGRWLGCESKLMKLLKELCKEDSLQRKVELLKICAIVGAMMKLHQLLSQLQRERQRGQRKTIGELLDSERSSLKSVIEASESKMKEIVEEFEKISKSYKDEFLEYTCLQEDIDTQRRVMHQSKSKVEVCLRNEKNVLKLVQDLLPRFRDFAIEQDILGKIAKDLVSKFEGLSYGMTSASAIKSKVNSVYGCQRAYEKHFGYLETNNRRFKEHCVRITRETGWIIVDKSQFDDAVSAQRRVNQNFRTQVNEFVENIKGQFRSAGQYYSPSSSSYNEPVASEEVRNIGRNIASRLKIAVISMNQFVSNFHVTGKDRCCVATFGTRYRLLQDYETLEAMLKLTFAMVLKNGTSGTTRLYDSMTDFYRHLVRRKRGPNTPVVLVCVTDGDDTDSVHRNNIERVAQDFRQFTDDPLHFLFLMGVGRGIGRAEKMERLMELSKGTYVSVKSFGKLQAAFLLLSLQIQKLVKIRTLEIETAEHRIGLGSISTEDHLTKRPLDYGIILDISGSMNSMVDLDKDLD